MPLVAISSPKGGVGKTTLVANIGAALARLGRRVVLIDFDVQNALRLHFGLPVNDPAGYAARAAETPDWRANMVAVASGVAVLPYGAVTSRQRLALDQALSDDGAAFLAAHLGRILADPNCVVLADTAPGPTPALDALDELADFRIAILLSDATSLALLPQAIEAGRFFRRPASPDRPLQLILNQIDLRRRLNRDVAAFVRQRAQGAMLGTVRQDEAMAEAMAQQECVFDYAPYSGAAQDIMEIAVKLDEALFTGRQQPLTAMRQQP